MATALDSLALTISGAVNGSIGRVLSETMSSSCSITPSQSTAFTVGTGAGQINQAWTDQRTLIASGSDRLDISADSGGASPVALTNAFGDSVDFAKVCGIFIRNTSSSAIIGIFGDAADPATMVAAATDQIKLRPGAFVLLCCGAADATKYAVAASEVLLIANLDAGVSATYEVTIWGVSA